MLDFVVCDDNEGLRRSVSNIIDSFMMKNNYAYKIKLYSDYNEKFMKEIDSFNRQKIYILDIEAPTKSGIDIARIIR